MWIVADIAGSQACLGRETSKPDKKLREPIEGSRPRGVGGPRRWGCVTGWVMIAGLLE